MVHIFSRALKTTDIFMQCVDQTLIVGLLLATEILNEWCVDLTDCYNVPHKYYS